MKEDNASFSVWQVCFKDYLPGNIRILEKRRLEEQSFDYGQKDIMKIK